MKLKPTESKLQSYLDGQNRLLISNLLRRSLKSHAGHNLFSGVCARTRDSRGRFVRRSSSTRTAAEEQ